MLLPDLCGIFGCYASRCCAIASPTMAKPEIPEPSRKHFGPRFGSYVFKAVFAAVFSRETMQRLSDCELIAVTCKSFQAYPQHLATPSAKLTPLPTRAAGDLVSSWKVRLLQLQFAWQHWFWRFVSEILIIFMTGRVSCRLQYTAI